MASVPLPAPGGEKNLACGVVVGIAGGVTSPPGSSGHCIDPNEWGSDLCSRGAIVIARDVPCSVGGSRFRTHRLSVGARSLVRV